MVTFTWLKGSLMRCFRRSNRDLDRDTKSMVSSWARLSLPISQSKVNILARSAYLVVLGLHAATQGNHRCVRTKEGRYSSTRTVLAGCQLSSNIVAPSSSPAITRNYVRTMFSRVPRPQVSYSQKAMSLLVSRRTTEPQ